MEDLKQRGEFMKCGVVVPTCRVELTQKFLDGWKDLFEKHNITLYLVEDKVAKSKFNFGKYKVKHYNWVDIDNDLKDNAKVIPRKCDGIRSYGFLQAYKDKVDYMVTLDDDCMPKEDIFNAYECEFSNSYKPFSSYYNIGGNFVGLDMFMRGFPFTHRKSVSPVIQYGGWHNVLDFDAVTQGGITKVDQYTFKQDAVIIDKYSAFTGCIMNVAVMREYIPVLYQLLMGKGEPFDRWGDIWSGLFAKKICDHLNVPIMVNGYASIIHTRASNIIVNLEKEANGYGVNETLWDKLMTIQLTKNNVLDCYYELSEHLKHSWFKDEKYGERLTYAMKLWVEECSK